MTTIGIVTRLETKSRILEDNTTDILNIYYVKIPIWDNVEARATSAVLPHTQINYQIGDTVYITFCDSRMDQAVILGMVGRINSDQTSEKWKDTITTKSEYSTSAAVIKSTSRTEITQYPKIKNTRKRENGKYTVTTNETSAKGLYLYNYDDKNNLLSTIYPSDFASLEGMYKHDGKLIDFISETESTVKILNTALGTANISGSDDDIFVPELMSEVRYPRVQSTEPYTTRSGQAAFGEFIDLYGKFILGTTNLYTFTSNSTLLPNWKIGGVASSTNLILHGDAEDDYYSLRYIYTDGSTEVSEYIGIGLTLKQSIFSGNITITVQYSGGIPIERGGTGASSAEGARTNLGIDSAIKVISRSEYDALSPSAGGDGYDANTLYFIYEA